MDLDRITSFLRAAVRRQAQTIVELPVGFAVFHRGLAASYDHNKVVLEAPTHPTTVEALFTPAGATHRLVVTFDDAVGTACGPTFTAAGYRHITNVIMVYADAVPVPAAHPPLLVEQVEAEPLADVVRRRWRRQLPSVDETVIDQLVAARPARRDLAEQVVFLAVRDDAAAVRSHADLYVDAGLAQIEDVFTEPCYTGRGYAGALVAEGLRRARACGADPVFLVADAHDWPRDWYARLGFAPLTHTHTFLRT
jgi:GNAT superfamily N-acetyltransferase